MNENIDYQKQIDIYHQICEVSNIGVWEINLVTDEHFWSDVVFRILGIPQPAAANLLTANKLMNPDTAERLIEAFIRVIETGKSFEGEATFRTPNGKQRLVTIQVNAVRTKDTSLRLAAQYERFTSSLDGEKTVRLFGTLQEIGSDKEEIPEVQKSFLLTQKDNFYYNSIIQNQTFYIIKTDMEGCYTYMNPYFCLILGIRAEDWLGKPSLGLILPEDQDLCIATVHRCLEEPDTIQRVILRKPLPNGRISTQWDFSLLKDEFGNPTEFLCIGHDITMLIKKQEDLQNLVEITVQQNKRLQDFTYIVSHNIRSHVANMSGIIGSVDLEDKTDRVFSFNLLNNSVTALDETIHYLNEIISIQENTNLPLGSLNLTVETDKVKQILQKTFTDSQAKITMTFGHDQELNTNPAYLESILLNLITNSIKYKSPDRDPEITISLEQSGGYQVLTIADNGQGIDLSKYHDRIFRMFNTFHGNPDAKGLGLFIVKTQIEALKGRVTVESEVGKGTSFRLYFPNNVPNH